MTSYTLLPFKSLSLSLSLSQSFVHLLPYPNPSDTISSAITSGDNNSVSLMSAAGKDPQPSNCDGDWIIVLPRRGKNGRKSLPKPQTIETKQWAPADSQTDAQTQSKLLKRMQNTITNLETSNFYRTLITQIQSPEVSSNVSKVLSLELQMPMVVYGIGSIESYDAPRLQLATAILLARQFNWIGGIEIFDPIISETESKVMESLGCTVLSINEQGRRVVKKPTLFFMPHCEAVLYDNLLETNWRPEQLNQMVVYGNSFERYEQYVSEFKSSSVLSSAKYVLEVRRFAKVFEIETVSDEFFKAFHDTCWHFFHLDPNMEMKSII